MQVTQTSQFSGSRDLIDPLVINLTGGPAQLSDSYFEFDLNGDGHTETLHQTATGTGFLVFDKNENGIIDDGSEMFGPQTGYGFAELSAYDEDGNGWIDENDSIFAQLSFMDFNQDGEQQLQDLATVGLGAIALQSAEMDFDLYDSQGNFQAQVARSGVALMENGAAVSIQEIYYADQAFGQGQLERTREIDVNNTGAITQNISPLTQFQFNNNIVNARNAETSVTLDLPNDSNPITLDNVQLSDVPLNNAQTASLNSNVLPSQVQIQNSVLLESSSTTAIDMSASEKRASVQAYFQNRIKNEQSDLIVNNDPLNQHHIRQSKPDDLTPSKAFE
ncbi:hypothetical protein ACU6U9_03985 [Pseudomonas sp. HK3]